MEPDQLLVQRKKVPSVLFTPRAYDSRRMVHLGNPQWNTIGTTAWGRKEIFVLCLNGAHSTQDAGPRLRDSSFPGCETVPFSKCQGPYQAASFSKLCKGLNCSLPLIVPKAHLRESDVCHTQKHQGSKWTHSSKFKAHSPFMKSVTSKTSLSWNANKFMHANTQQAMYGTHHKVSDDSICLFCPSFCSSIGPHQIHSNSDDYRRVQSF